MIIARVRSPVRQQRSYVKNRGATVEDEFEVEPGDGFIHILGTAEVGRQNAWREHLSMLWGPTVENARLLNVDRPEAGEDVTFGMKAVADNLSATGGVGYVGMSVDPIGDLSLDGSGEHITCSLAENFAKDVMAVGQWHDADIGGRLIHGGVLLCCVGTFDVGQTSPGYAALPLNSIH